MTNQRTTRVVSVVAAAILGFGGAIAVQSPAVAATPACSTWKQYGNYKLPVSSAGSWVCSMGPNSNGIGVKILQFALNDCYGDYLVWVGWHRISTDSDFGPDTKQALKLVQQGLGITADGVYGPQTATYLYFSDLSGNCEQGTNLHG